MQQSQQRRTGALKRSSAFIVTHADVLGGIQDSEGAKQLDDAIAQIDSLVDTQGASTLQLVALANRQKQLIVDLKDGHMGPIASFARARLQGTPDFAALTRPVSKIKRVSDVVAAARAMATAAAPHADALIAGGFPADVIAQLTAAATAVSDTVGERASVKVARVQATRGIEVQLGRGRDAVTMLNGLVRRNFLRDKAFLAGWDVARRVVSKPGPARGSTEEAPAAPAPAAAVAPPTVAGVMHVA